LLAGIQERPTEFPELLREASGLTTKQLERLLEIARKTTEESRKYGKSAMLTMPGGFL
jgi:hypothetical protein